MALERFLFLSLTVKEGNTVISSGSAFLSKISGMWPLIFLCKKIYFPLIISVAEGLTDYTLNL